MGKPTPIHRVRGLEVISFRFPFSVMIIQTYMHSNNVTQVWHESIDDETSKKCLDQNPLWKTDQKQWDVQYPSQLFFGSVDSTYYAVLYGH